MCKYKNAACRAFCLSCDNGETEEGCEEDCQSLSNFKRDLNIQFNIVEDSRMMVALFDSSAYSREEIEKATDDEIKELLEEDVDYSGCYEVSEFQRLWNDMADGTLNTEWSDSFIRFFQLKGKLKYKNI